MTTIMVERFRCLVQACAATAAVMIAGIAKADTYDLSMMTGGAQSSLSWAGKHLLLEVTQGPTTPINTVLFKFTNQIPIPAGDTLPSSIARIWIDTGAHGDLITGVSIAQASSGVSMVPGSSYTHPFFKWHKPVVTPEYNFTVVPESNAAGIGPGESLVLAAALASGKTLSDVLDAVDEGIVPATASQGLRVNVVVWHILGSLPYDDAGFITNALISEVTPPPPPPGTCP